MLALKLRLACLLRPLLWFRSMQQKVFPSPRCPRLEIEILYRAHWGRLWIPLLCSASPCSRSSSWSPSGKFRWKAQRLPDSPLSVLRQLFTHCCLRIFLELQCRRRLNLLLQEPRSRQSLSPNQKLDAEGYQLNDFQINHLHLELSSSRLARLRW